MTNSETAEQHAADNADHLSARCRGLGIRIAVAESLTGGRIASCLAAAKGSGEWFAGGIVAYSSEVKHGLLDVPAGSVISQVSAETMARSAARLLGADAAVAATGAGGPSGQDGEAPGTTWIAALASDRIVSELHRFSGDPLEILAQTQDRAVQLLVDLVIEQFR